MIVLKHNKPARSEVNESLKDVLSDNSIGFHQLTEMNEVWTSSVKRSLELKKFKHLCVIGIGGSSLGVEVIKESFFLDSLTIIDSPDPLSLQQKLNKLNMPDTHFCIISKSGSTLETLSIANIVISQIASLKLNLQESFTVILSDDKSELSKWAQKNHITILKIPENVGGRFSILSPVGLFTCAFFNLNIEEIKKGAVWAKNNNEIVAQTCEFVLNSFTKEKWITMFWMYSQQLSKFGSWLQQLWSESLAKKNAPRISTPITLVGPQDQHSMLQQIMEGNQDKSIIFFRVNEVENCDLRMEQNHFEDLNYLKNKSLGFIIRCEVESIELSVSQNDIPNTSFTVDRVDEWHLGALFMLFELVIATLGLHLKLNTFDQPGVELGKKLTKSLLIK